MRHIISGKEWKRIMAEKIGAAEKVINKIEGGLVWDVWGIYSGLFSEDV